MAAKQGTLADAKQYFMQVAERRKARGDKKGAAEIAIRLGTLDPEDLEARLRAAQARRRDRATRRRRCASSRTSPAGSRRRNATPTRSSRCRWPTTSTSRTTGIRARLFTAYLGGDSGGGAPVRQGRRRAEAGRRGARRRPARPTRCWTCSPRSPTPIRRTSKSRPASRWPTSPAATSTRHARSSSPETAGTNPALWLTLAEMELRGNRFAEGKAAVAAGHDARPRPDPGGRRARLPAGRDRTPTPATSRSRPSPTRRSPTTTSPPPPWRCTNSPRACRSHLVALMRLVEICVDGGLEVDDVRGAGAARRSVSRRRAAPSKRASSAKTSSRASRGTRPTSIASAARW